MNGPSHILLLLGGPKGPDLKQRLEMLGMTVHCAEDLAEAGQLMADASEPIPAVLVPVEAATNKLKSGLKALHRAGPATGTQFVAYGGAPERAVRKTLRSAGVSLALWEPFDDGTLRFQVNRALTGDRDNHGRDNRRVPTFLLARIEVGGREKDAVVYSLSSGGAFLETPRASMDGAELGVEIRLPSQSVRCRAEVLYANVPGNLQRPNLPLGMGVRFVDLEAETTDRLRGFVDDRFAELLV